MKSPENNLDGFERFLEQQRWCQYRRKNCRCEARKLAAFRPELPLPERLQLWVETVCRTAPSLRRARDRVDFTLSFLDFLGIGDLRDQLAAARSPLDVIRELRTPGVSWPEALERARAAPRFLSSLAVHFEDFLGYWTGRQMKLGHWPFVLKRLDRLAHKHNVQTPGDLTPALLQEFLCHNRPAPRTHNFRISKLRTLRRFLERRGVPFHLPAGLSLPEPTFRPHLFSLNEVGRILGSMREYGRQGRSFRWAGIEAVVFLLYACGLRVSEAVRLRIRDVDLDQVALFIDCTKFYKQRWVPLGEAAFARLEAYREARLAKFRLNGPDERLFLNDTGRLLLGARVRFEFNRIVEELGIRSRGTGRPRLHDLRHTLAVHRLYQWYADGADVQNKLPLLSAYLGHDRLHHTEVYLHLTEDLIRQAGRNFQLSFEQIVGRWSGDERA